MTRSEGGGGEGWGILGGIGGVIEIQTMFW